MCLVCLAVSACGPEAATQQAPAWASDLESADPTVRAHAVEAVITAPAPDSGERLARMIETDSDELVRERAVLAYGRVTGRDGVPLLKQIALGDRNPDVKVAALAALEVIRAAFPQAPRGWTEVHFPEDIAHNRAFEVRAVIGSPQAVQKARVHLGIPSGVEIVEPESGSWSGPIQAGEEVEVPFVLRALEPTPIDVTLRVKLEYGPLDYEVFERGAAASFDGSSGRFDPLPSSSTRGP